MLKTPLKKYKIFEYSIDKKIIKTQLKINLEGLET